MPALEKRIRDQASGRLLEARVHVLASSGEYRVPGGALRKVGQGEPYFYCKERLTVEVAAPAGSAERADATCEPMDHHTKLGGPVHLVGVGRR